MTELPPPATRRWVARRKAAVVAAVSSGIITLEEVCARYRMSEEEFFAWQRTFETFGLLGLRATCVQQHRGAPRSGPRDPAPRPISPRLARQMSSLTIALKAMQEEAAKDLALADAQMSRTRLLQPTRPEHDDPAMNAGAGKPPAP